MKCLIKRNADATSQVKRGEEIIEDLRSKLRLVEQQEKVTQRNEELRQELKITKEHDQEVQRHWETLLQDADKTINQLRSQLKMAEEREDIMKVLEQTNKANHELHQTIALAEQIIKEFKEKLREAEAENEELENQLGILRMHFQSCLLVTRSCQSFDYVAT